MVLFFSILFVLHVNRVRLIVDKNSEPMSAMKNMSARLTMNHSVVLYLVSMFNPQGN